MSVPGIIGQGPYATRKAVKRFTREQRRDRARYGWFNWYLDRGRMTVLGAAKDWRRVSWRRAL